MISITIYQVNELQPGEFVAAFGCRLRATGVIVGSQKWSKRFDQDISAVCTAYRLAARRRHGDRLPNGLRWPGGNDQACRALRSRWSTVRHGLQRRSTEPAPRWRGLHADQDMRASADMRLVARQNLLRRFWLETRGEAEANGVHVWSLEPSAKRCRTTARTCMFRARRPTRTTCPNRATCCISRLA